MFAFILGAMLMTPELLKQWGISEQAYRAMAPEKKLELQADLALGEEARQRRLELIRLIRPDDWKKYVNERGFVTPEGVRLIEAYEAGLAKKGLPVPVNVTLERKDGKPITAEDFQKAQVLLDQVFDNTSTMRDVPEGSKLVVDARVSNETVHSVTLSLPERGWTFEVGQLGIDGRSPLLAPSPYGNVTKRWEGEKSWTDYRVRAQVGYVDMKARYFANGPDPRIERMMELGSNLGVDQATLNDWRSHVTYDDAYKAQGLVVASLMAQLGRAYNLFGPVDVAWAATSLTKVFHLAPNQAFDESAGFRVRLPGDDLFIGLFGGVTQNLSPVGNRLYQEMMDTGTVTPKLDVENSPHWTVSLWGPRFALSGGQQYNRDTKVTQGEAALMSTFKRTPVAVRVQHKQEIGTEIGFDRRTSRVQLDASLGNGWNAFMAYEKDDFKFGNAEVKSDGVWAGARWDIGGGKARLTVDHLFGGGYGDVSPLKPYMGDAAKAMTEALAAGVEVAEGAQVLLDGLITGASQAELEILVNQLGLALNQVDPTLLAAVGVDIPEIQRQLLEQIRDKLHAPHPDLVGDLKTNLRDAVELARLLGDSGTWEAVGVAAGRKALIESLAKDQVIDIPIIDKQLTLKTRAPALIAAAGALNSRGSPLRPVLPEQASPWLLSEAGKELGLPAGATADDVANKLMDMGSEKLVEFLHGRIDEAVAGLAAQYDPAQAASSILGALPPQAAAALQAQYGPNLEGLLPPLGTAPDEIKKFLNEKLVPELVAALRARLGPAAAQAVGELSAWAGEVLAREINLATIHLILASEQLERLTVDRGKKAGDLGVEMIYGSFRRLDARKRSKLARSLVSARKLVEADRRRGDERIAERLTVIGKRRLALMQLEPAWPAGLTVVVEDQDWAPLLSSFGDAEFFDALTEAAKKWGKREAIGVIQIAYSPAGSSVRKEKDGSTKVTWGPNAQPKWLADYLD